MLKTIKYLFILILMVGANGVVNYTAAQASGNILVTSGGKTLRQSDVDKVIKFYEWAFGTEFTDEHRKRFQELKEEFRNDPTGS